MEQKSFMKACADFFGKKDGQSLREFNDELKKLSQDDRIEFREMFKQAGIEVIGV
jgi:hypothetical protein